MKKKALFICGSLNQTTQLHQIAKELPEVEQRFTPFYGDAIVDGLRRLGLIETSIGGNKRRAWCTDYLTKHGLTIDLHGARGDYDLVVTCTDMLVPENIRRPEAITELDQVSRQKFEEAFAQINAHFATAFQTLFGGGIGQMRLSEPDSAGDAGIDIAAQPLGKRLQNVLLLSGGEKALSALSLLVGLRLAVGVLMV